MDPMAFEFGPEPAWVQCADCGVETMQTRCMRCSDQRDREREDRAAEARCNLPSTFAWAVLGSTELAAAVRHHRLSIEQLAARLRASRRAIVAGSTGVGKTSLSVAVLRERVPHCLFAPASLLGSFGPEGDALRERAERARVLLIDDLGKDAQTANQYLIGIIDRRYNNADLVTWITTGLSVGQIKARYDDGIRRRVVDEATRIMLGVDEKAQANE